jgi:hypothetical protein
MVGAVGFEPTKTPSAIFAKTHQTLANIEDSSHLMIFGQFVFAKRNEEFLSLIVPKRSEVWDRATAFAHVSGILRIIPNRSPPSE